MDIVTLGAALSGAKKYTDDVVHSIAGGINYKGEVNYYSNLPSNPTLGDAYTVKYSGTTGSNLDGTEYVWAENGGVAQWVDFSKDSYTKAETDALLNNKQNVLTVGTNLDDKPIEDSENPITSGGVYNTVGNIDLALDSLIMSLEPKTITANGTYNPEDDGVDGYSEVTVNVSSGGATGGSDVIFYDYNGTVVASYSAADFANLSAMPANPTHTGLTAQGWNWTLADAKTYVAAYGKLNIGQMYITSDGKTRLYYVIPKDNLTLDLSLELDENTELDVDWGDGSEHTTWTSGSSKTHTYANGGRYTVAITVVNGGFSCQSLDSIGALKKVEFGSNVTSIGANAFSYCYALSSITITNSVTSIQSYAFNNCQALSTIIIPNSVTSIEDSAFYECYALSSIIIPNSVTSIETQTFKECCALSSMTILNSVTSIGQSAFYACQALSTIIIPNSVTSIEDSAFSYCTALLSITFEPTTPPELSGDLGLPTTCIIRVPQGTLSDYTSAENYPDPNDYIYEEY